VFAALYGTLALLDADDQPLVNGFVINKFRGDLALLTPGLDQITSLTGRPVLGVLPYLTRTWLDAEDAMPIGGRYGADSSAAADDALQVAVVLLPHISNFTDVDALALEPGVAVRFVSAAAEVAAADLVVLPGTRSTVADLAWLRERRLDSALRTRAEHGKPILAICGGYQMLGTVIHDGIEGSVASARGLGLLPVQTKFLTRKALGRTEGYAGGVPVSGYEIHHGRVDVCGGDGWFTSAPHGGAQLDGCREGQVHGTLWHGIMESDAFRRAYLSEVAALAGRTFVPVGEICFEAGRQQQFDALADAVAQYLDTDALLSLIQHGPTMGLPVLSLRS
jgi:adenosylcobyric acid synthase